MKTEQNIVFLGPKLRTSRRRDVSNWRGTKAEKFPTVALRKDDFELERLDQIIELSAKAGN
jgi:hypothetical protein